MSCSLAIVIPIYKQNLNLLEQFSLDYLLTKAGGRKLIFIAPQNINTDYYRERYPTIEYSFHDDHFFSSVSGYNEMLLDVRFYERFLDYSFILIHQTDALLLNNDLDEWMDLGYDYIGAPWPQGMLLNLDAENAARYKGTQFHAFVGNGGFSLRNVQSAIGVIRSEHHLHLFWRMNALNEDCFFAFAGLFTTDFKVPPPAIAARFALEVNPRQYFETNDNHLPTGCHAWWKYDFGFWQEFIPDLRQFDTVQAQSGHPRTAKQPKQHIAIFCDGGFGNRLNTLVSGLAIARYFDVTPRVFWPRNNWCQAGFSEIFASALDISEQSLTDLAGTLGNVIPLLHDEKGADALKTPFQSAYAYASLDHFGQEAVATGKDIFYYPALIPQWLPIDRVVMALRECHYLPHIIDTVTRFVGETIGTPFHGLHLRRTDLNVGYSDDEVQAIIRLHPTETFFVCSDDPIAEALAAVHPNVFRRDKASYVGKRTKSGDWMALTADDDGRLYHSNINRDAESVIDAVIDMLVLAHSSIVGFSGSTFQNMARLYGAHTPIVELDKPSQEIEYMALSTLIRMIQAGSLPMGESVSKSLALHGDGRKSDAVILEKAAIEYAESKNLRDINLFLLHYNLAAHLLMDGHPFEASLYGEKARALIPDNNEVKLLMDTVKKVMGHAH